MEMYPVRCFCIYMPSKYIYRDFFINYTVLHNIFNYFFILFFSGFGMDIHMFVVVVSSLA